MTKKIIKDHFDKLMRTKSVWNATARLGEEDAKKLFRIVELEMEHMASSIYRETVKSLEKNGHDKAASIVTEAWLGKAVERTPI